MLTAASSLFTSVASCVVKTDVKVCFKLFVENKDMSLSVRLSSVSLSLVLSCSYVSRRLNDLSKHSPLWRTLSRRHWLLTE